jgi:hypothetical protein
MPFDQLRTEVKGIDFDAIRRDEDHYFEGVIVRDRLAGLTLRLERYLGHPVWPSKSMLSEQVRELLSPYGGIREGQGLYLFNEENCSVFAMLWPWGDGVHITLRLGIISRPGTADPAQG